MTTRPLRSALTAAVLVSLAVGAGACAPANYKSLYKGTGPDQPPINPNEARVVGSRAELTGGWVQLGNYSGHAPTAEEAQRLAASECAKHGADVFALNTPPYESEGRFKVDGICVRTDAARSSGRPAQ